MFPYADTHRHRHTDTQTHRHTHTHTNAQIFYTAMAHQLGVDPATKQVLPCAWSNKSWVEALYMQALDPRHNGSVSSIDWCDYLT